MKNQNEIKLKNNKIDSISVSVIFYKEKDYIVAECPSLNVATDGKDLDHAKAMFKEAFELWIESVNADDFSVKAVLKNLGWKLGGSFATTSVKREAKAQRVISSNRAVINNPHTAWCF
jgi:predicted RNase H-like HicB family nuclease